MLTDHDQTLEEVPAAGLSRIAVALASGVAGLGIGFLAGAWSSQSAVESQCETAGTATAGESAFECVNIRKRSDGFR